MSSVMTPLPSSTESCSSPKSSPTGPTTLASVKKLAARLKWTAEPPSIHSRSPNGVRARVERNWTPTVSDKLVRTRPAYVQLELQIEEFGGPGSS